MLLENNNFEKFIEQLMNRILNLEIIESNNVNSKLKLMQI